MRPVAVVGNVVLDVTVDVEFSAIVVSALADDAGWETACERGMAVARRWVSGVPG